MLPDGVSSANAIFTSQTWLMDHVIVVRNGIIQNLRPKIECVGQLIDKHFSCLIPSFLDVQIYGAGGKLFSEFPEVDALQRLQKYCEDGKTDHFLPTITTNKLEVFLSCIDAVKAYWEIGGTGCLGLHMEGPWISKEKRGAHIESLIHRPTIEEVTEILEYGKGVIKMVTIAPEECSVEVLELIKSYGVVISAGHSNATYETATNSFNGPHITTATHLYNAMSALQHRNPGMVGAILNHDRVRCSIVPDGFHVDFAAVEVAKKIMGERLFVITDAVTETSTGHYPHVLVGDKYESEGILSGSALTMTKAVTNLTRNCPSISLDEALRMCSLYPAQVLNLHHEIGCIAVGYKAAIVEWTL